MNTGNGKNYNNISYLDYDGFLVWFVFFLTKNNMADNLFAW